MAELKAHEHKDYLEVANEQRSLAWDSRLATQVARFNPTHLIYLRSVSAVEDVENMEEDIVALSVFDALTQEQIMPTCIYDFFDYSIPDDENDKADAMLSMAIELLLAMFHAPRLLCIIDCPEFHDEHRTYRFMDTSVAESSPAPAKHLH